MGWRGAESLSEMEEGKLEVQVTKCISSLSVFILFSLGTY